MAKVPFDKYVSIVKSSFGSGAKKLDALFVNAGKASLVQYKMPEQQDELFAELIAIASELKVAINCKAYKGRADMNYLNAGEFETLVNKGVVAVMGWCATEDGAPSWRPELGRTDSKKIKTVRKTATPKKPMKLSRFG